MSSAFPDAMQRVCFALLATMPLASAGDQLTCAIDGAGSLDAATNAGVYLWAATERCPKGAAASDDIKCEIDVASAVQSVTDMANIIAKAVDTCAGDLKAENAQCGMAAGSLVSAASGLAAGTGSLTHWIEKGTAGGNAVIDATTLRTGKCIVNAKSVMSDIFQAAAAIKAAQAGCAGDDGEVCAAKALSVVSVLSGLGSAIANVVGYCSPHDDKTARMSGDIMGLVGVLDKVAQAGIAVKQQCHVAPARLYSSVAMQSTSDHASVSMSSLVAFALVPMAAIIGFAGGRRNKAMKNDRDVE